MTDEPTPQTEVCAVKNIGDISDAVEDAYMLIEFSARQGLKLESPNIEAVIEISKKVLCTRPTTLTVHEELRFWEAFNAISAKVAPITVEGIKTTTELRTGVVGNTLSFIGVSSEASRFLMFTKWVAVAVFFSIMFVQIYWMIGVQTFNEAAATEASIIDIQANREQKMAELKTALTAYEVRPNKDTMSQVMGLIKETADINFSKTTLRPKNIAAIVQLENWNNTWLKVIPFFTFSTKTSNYAEAGQNVKRQIHFKSAETALKTLSEYILPALYALLGSLVFILRTSTKKIQLYEFTSLSKFRMGSRWLLGMIAGVAISWVFADNGPPKTSNGELVATFDFLVGLGPWAAAFVIGYNVEIIYRLLDKIADTVPRAGNPPPQTPPTPAA